MSLLVSNPVLEAIAASHADLTVEGGIVHVANVAATGNEWIDMEYPKIHRNPKPAILRSLAERVQRQTFTFVAANDTKYSFVITQYQPDGTVFVQPITVQSDVTGATAATIATQINAKIASYAGAGLHVTSSGASTVITVVADTGYPVFYMTNAVNGTIAQAAAMTITFSGSTDATPTVVTSVAHGLVTGDQVIPTGGDPGSPIAAVDGELVRITRIDANSFSVDGTVATGTPDATGGTMAINPQASRGQYTDLVAAGIVGGSSSGTYASIYFEFGLPDTMQFEMERNRVYAQRLWMNETDAQFADLATYWNEVLNGFNAGATTADPDMFAVA